MGYSLTIGEAKLVKYDGDEDLDYDDYLEIEAEEVHDENSPAFGDPTDYTNQRWPSYTAWWDFCEFTGLIGAMYDETGNILGGHPGYLLITPKFKSAVDKAMKRHMMRYPDAEPKYGTERPQDYHLCRLTWLKYWTDWALENCEYPIFRNT